MATAATTTSPATLRAFVSYSHCDYEVFSAFQKHLRALERAFPISFWADTRIDAGYYWSKAINDAIDASQIFVLLISPGFLASDYIYDRKIPAIQTRHANCRGLIIPVVVSRCMWEIVANVLQASPMETGRVKPVADWRKHEDGLNQVRVEMTNAIQTRFGFSPRTVAWVAP
jgi:hypothetical protein